MLLKKMAIIEIILINLHNISLKQIDYFDDHSMKKISTLIAVFLLIMVSGQDFKYGLTANFHQGSIVGVHDVSKGAFGGSLGFFGQIPLVENDIYDSAWLYLMPQIEYHMGGEIAKAEENKFGVQKFNHDYLSMQVYLKYFFKRYGYKTDFFVFAGPSIEYLVRQEKIVDPGYDAAYYNFNFDNNVSQFGYGVSLGTGFKISDQFEAFLRYDHGFSKVYPDNPNNTYNRMLAVGVNFYLQSNWR